MIAVAACTTASPARSSSMRPTPRRPSVAHGRDCARRLSDAPAHTAEAGSAESILTGDGPHPVLLDCVGEGPVSAVDGRHVGVVVACAGGGLKVVEPVD